MRLGWVLTLLVVALIGVVLTVGTVASVSEQGHGAAAAPYRLADCQSAIGPISGSGNGAAQAARLSAQQRGTAAHIMTIGKQRAISPLGWQVAIQAGMTESGLRNLGYGDRDSLGIFQMRPSQNWGTPQQLQDPAYEINKFYDRLLTVPNWQSQDPGQSAQDVERSAFPERYRAWQAMAAALLKGVGKVANTGGCGGAVNAAALSLPPPSAKAAVAIRFALSQLGKPYLWGATGPDAYDCSGLMQRSYAAAGITLPRVSRDQFAGGGAHLPVRQAQPGDLIFLATDPSNPATIHHVEMYLGKGKIVEAQQNGVPLKISAFSFAGSQVVQQAVRPAVAAAGQ
ncbi:MAG: C40 family peptidase [Sciscionella sp.]